MAGESLGAILREIRLARKLSLQTLAGRIGLSAMFLSLLERDERTATLETIAAYERLGLNARESWQLRQRCQIPEFRKACADGCSHDGAMEPGPGGAGRDEACVNCSSCLDVFLSKWPTADESHCPTNCSRRVHAPWHVRFYLRSSSEGQSFSIKEK